MPWYRYTALLLSTALCATLTACAYGPVADGAHSSVQQPLVHRVADWESAADVSVHTLLSALQQAGVPRTTPVYLQPQNHMSMFDHGWHELLTTKLVQSGVPVRLRPEQAPITMAYHADLIERHGASHHELMLSTSAQQADQYVARETLLFYVADRDSAWFTPSTADLFYPNTTLEVVGP